MRKKGFSEVRETDERKQKKEDERGRKDVV